MEAKNENRIPDYGADPIGDGMFRMVPSGDIVALAERNSRLARYRSVPQVDCLGLSWEQVATMQGGLATLDITRTKKNRKRST